MDTLEFPDIDTVVDAEIPLAPPSCLQVSAPTEECFLKSEIASKEVMALYIEGEEKLCKVLKDVSLEDHVWCLKSFDCYGKAVVILHCLECKKDFGGIDG